MFRALSRRSRSRSVGRQDGYEKLKRTGHDYDDDADLDLDHDEAAAPPPTDIKLTRAKSVPPPPPRDLQQPKTAGSIDSRGREKKAAEAEAESEAIGSKVHPLLSLIATNFSINMRRKRKKKATARPEFSRYLEYVKEGGVWDNQSDSPVIYYK